MIIRPDVDDIVAKASTLIDDPAFLYQLGHAGQEKSLVVFDPVKRAENIMNFIIKKYEAENDRKN